MLSRRECGEIAEGEFILLFRRIADRTLGRDENPIATIQTILGALDVGRGIPRGELNDGENACWAAASRNDSNSFQMIDHRGRIVHSEPLPFALVLDRESGG